MSTRRHTHTIGVLIEQVFFPEFPLFSFQEKRKQEKQETFPNFGNLTEGKILETIRIQNILGGGNGKYAKTKIARKKIWKCGQKVLR